jgi:acyl-CoA reductase-like NAD-dependent aldehyde dehydrogenase
VVQIKYIKVEADKLVREYGTEAYEKAQEAFRSAARRKDPRRSKFLERVAREIAKREQEGTGANPQ